MGTIVTRHRKNGSAAFLAQILIKRDGVIVYRQSRTFDRKPVAAGWIKRREEELATPEGLSEAQSPRRALTLADVIDRYCAESQRQAGKTKLQVLSTIKRHDIGAMRCGDIASPDIIKFAQEIGKTTQPQTVQNYLSHLGAVFQIARPMWGVDLDAQAMTDAMKVAKRMGLTSKSRERNRRPTLPELDALLTHFGIIKRNRPSSIPMQRIVAFAIFSTRRLEEVTRIKWADLDETHSTIVVRDMKNPGAKLGNDVACELPPEALRVIRAMPRAAAEIFPYSGESISAAFTRTCKILGIKDLHFHDLRHEGISRLFERGGTIPQVASVSGHRSWQSLKRYSHLRQAGDKFAGWPWLDVIAPTVAKLGFAKPSSGAL